MTHFIKRSRRPSGSRNTVLTVIALVTSLLLLAPPPTATAVPADWRYRPSRWTPTDFVSLLDRDAAWGDVAYWWKWLSPNNTSSSLFDPGGRGTMELGWKNTGNDGCDGRDGPLHRGGFPAEMNIQNDHTEDSSDAVIWFADLDLLRADTSANPGKEYSIWWECNGDDRFGAGGPYLESEAGTWDTIESPNTTFSDAHLHYIPAEKGLEHMPIDNEFIQTNAYVPWTDNYNFENPDLSRWVAYDSTKTRIVGGAEQGGAYVYVEPTNPNDSWLYQENFAVRNSYVREGGQSKNVSQGSNTDYQFEGTFRCPTWAPAFNNKGTDHCVVEVWLKGDTEGWAGNGFFWNIPADGRWYAVLSEAWDAQQDNRFHDVWINTNGYPMDVDVVWVQSGI